MKDLKDVQYVQFGNDSNIEISKAGPLKKQPPSTETCEG